MELLIDLQEKIDEYSKINDMLCSPEQLMKWHDANLSEEGFLAIKAVNFSSSSINGIEK